MLFEFSCMFSLIFGLFCFYIFRFYLITFRVIFGAENSKIFVKILSHFLALFLIMRSVSLLIFTCIFSLNSHSFSLTNLCSFSRTFSLSIFSHNFSFLYSLSRSFSRIFSLLFLTQNRVVPCCFLFSFSLSISAQFHMHFHAHFCIEFCKNSAHFLIHFSQSLSLTFSLFRWFYPADSLAHPLLNFSHNFTLIFSLNLCSRSRSFSRTICKRNF